jgi:hypothetical protein
MTDLGYVTDGSDTSSAARRQGGLVHDGAERLQLSRADGWVRWLLEQAHDGATIQPASLAACLDRA